MKPWKEWLVLIGLVFLFINMRLGYLYELEIISDIVLIKTYNVVQTFMLFLIVLAAYFWLGEDENKEKEGV